MHRIERIDCGRDAAQHRHGVQHRGVLRQVGTVDGEDVTFAEASLGQPAGQPMDQLDQRGIGHRPARWAIDQGGPIAKALRVLQHELLESDLGDVNVREPAAKDHAQDPMGAPRSSRLRAIERRWISSVPS